ncbi:hypothetical protein Prede_1323 [Prevotella dentalis DSM 3688]|nr:hypothetical protein Prede_1323 [Prevotella dentalis DSM 3688]
MESMNKLKLSVAVLASVALVSGCWLLGRGLTHFRQDASTITVTGMAEKEITSDLIVWNITVTGEAGTRSGAFAEFERSVATVRKYLRQNGIADSSISSGSADITKLTKSQYDSSQQRYFSIDNGFSVSQTLSVSSSQLATVEQVYQKISELYGRGIDFSSSSPLYYYTRLNDLKMEMLHAAGANALERAKTIAEGCDAHVGDLKSSAMGVFQIVGKNSNEDYSWGGTFNTDSKEKVASITVKAVYKAD